MALVLASLVHTQRMDYEIISAYTVPMKTYLNASGYSLTLGEETLPIVIRRHRASRRIVIRYRPLDHSLRLTLPRHATIRQGLRFIEEKQSWIAAQVKARPKKAPLGHGQAISVLGKPYTLSHSGGRGVVHIEGETIIVPGAEEFIARRVKDWLIATARAEITRLAHEKAALLNKKIRRISLRDTTSHWGSCSHDGGLSFSWRLALAPYEALDYVVCHEVAHLAELNHSPKFWAIVEALCPDYRRWRQWIKQNGSELYGLM